MMFAWDLQSGLWQVQQLPESQPERFQDPEARLPAWLLP
jgi:hypothetical protein